MTRKPYLFRLILAAWTALAPGLLAAEEGGEPYNTSLIAFALDEKDLIPENIAHDPRTGRFFIGSTRKGKIVVRHADGRVQDFIAPRAHGLWMVIGMKADPARRALWVASSGGDNLENFSPGDGRPAGLFEFDLDTGRLRWRHLLDGRGETHFLNDIAVAGNGDVYVTHMFEAAQIWRLDRRTRTFAPFYRGDSDFRYPNGITLSPDDRRLYVAHAGGISAIELSSRERHKLLADESLGGVDGLYFHDGLVAVRPDAGSVSHHRLDAGGLKVTATRVLERAHPLFDDPTTGVVVGRQLYYLANAQFGRFDGPGQLFPPHRLYQPVILRVALK